MCGWQVKLCDPLVTHGPYLSAFAVVLPIIRRYINYQITLTLTAILSKAVIIGGGVILGVKTQYCHTHSCFQNEQNI